MNVAAISDQFPDGFDLFICCGSYEQRCLSIPLAIDPASVRDVLIAEHVDLHRYVGLHTHKLKNHFGPDSKELKIFTNNPIRAFDSIISSLRRASSSNPRSVLIDISTFTHETLLMLLQGVLYALSENIKLVLAYTKVREYDPGTPVCEKWLSKGIEEIRSVVGFPGEILPGRGTHLVLFHGFEVERSKEIIVEFQPEVVSIARAIECAHTDLSHVPANERVHREVLKFARNVTDVLEFDFSPTDYRACFHSLRSHLAVETDLNLIVAPMNSKLSSIAVMLAALDDDRLQVCYAQPSLYNYLNYSLASDECVVFTVPEFFTSDFSR